MYSAFIDLWNMCLYVMNIKWNFFGYYFSFWNLLIWSIIAIVILKVVYYLVG